MKDMMEEENDSGKRATPLAIVDLLNETDNGPQTVSSSPKQSAANDVDLVDVIDVDRITPNNPIENSCNIFQPGPRKGCFKITEKLLATDVRICTELEMYAPCSLGGTATFYQIGDLDLTKQDVLDRINYNVRCRADRPSTAFFLGETIQVTRRTLTCSGIKRCETMNLPTKSPPSRIPDVMTVEYDLALQVFFFGQNAFPIVCSHHGVASVLSQSERSHLLKYRQERRPNWTFREGKCMSFGSITGTKTSQLPDFIGCSEYGKSSIPPGSRCSRVSVPPHLQGANPQLVLAMVNDALQGILPTYNSASSNCAILPVTYVGSRCPSPSHLQVAPMIQRVHCKVVYHYLFPTTFSGQLDWFAVLGVGSHSHPNPPPRPVPRVINGVVKNIYAEQPNIRLKEVARKVEEKFGLSPSLNTIKNIRSSIIKEMYPFGRGLDGLISRFRSPHEKTYIMSIVDERDLDQTRASVDQVGVAIVLGLPDSLKESCKNPTFGCDGTFGVVCSYERNLNFELCSIVTKHEQSGKVYAVMRLISSRRTKAARMILMDCFISTMRSYGLKDPASATPKEALLMNTDFETTFSIALGEVLHAQYGSLPPLEYARVVCVGCDVHAKRIVLEKVHLPDQSRIYSWAVGTRRLERIEEVSAALHEMELLGTKWFHFSKWLRDNPFAHLLWFSGLYGLCGNRNVQARAFMDNNLSESMNAKLKSVPSYLLTNRRGFDLLEAVDNLSAIDRQDFNDFSTYTMANRRLSVPHWKRAQWVSSSSRKRSTRDTTVVVLGKKLDASQPKKAKSG